MSSTVTFSCTPRLGSFVVEIPSMTWSHSGFTEMGCYKPSPATWVVGLSIDVFLAHFFTSPWRDDSEMLWKWMLMVLSNSRTILSLWYSHYIAFISFWECSMFSWCFLSNLSCQLLWKLKQHCHFESWWIYPPRVPGCQSPPGLLHF